MVLSNDQRSCIYGSTGLSDLLAYKISKIPTAREEERKDKRKTAAEEALEKWRAKAEEALEKRRAADAARKAKKSGKSKAPASNDTSPPPPNQLGANSKRRPSDSPAKAGPSKRPRREPSDNEESESEDDGGLSPPGVVM